MKKATSLVFLLTSLIIMSHIGCKKYEDGPLISFRTKENRLCNKRWRYNDPNRVYYYYFYKDGTVEYENSNLIPFLPYKIILSWRFAGDKKKIIIDSGTGYTILRLTKDELWWGGQNSYGTWESHYISD